MPGRLRQPPLWPWGQPLPTTLFHFSGFICFPSLLPSGLLTHFESRAQALHIPPGGGGCLCWKAPSREWVGPENCLKGSLGVGLGRGWGGREMVGGEETHRESVQNRGGQWTGGGERRVPGRERTEALRSGLPGRAPASGSRLPSVHPRPAAPGPAQRHPAPSFASPAQGLALYLLGSDRQPFLGLVRLGRRPVATALWLRLQSSKQPPRWTTRAEEEKTEDGRSL